MAHVIEEQLRVVEAELVANTVHRLEIVMAREMWSMSAEFAVAKALQMVLAIVMETDLMQVTIAMAFV